MRWPWASHVTFILFPDLPLGQRQYPRQLGPTGVLVVSGGALGVLSDAGLGRSTHFL